MTTRAEEIAAEEYPDTSEPDAIIGVGMMQVARLAFINGYKQGQQDSLVQRFVDHHAKWVGYGCLEADMEWDSIITDCFAAGFTP